jgi:hypothetical protein
MPEQGGIMNIYQWKANSNAAPFFSDLSEGFMEEESPMAALRKVVKNYNHPCGLFSAVILEPTPENRVLVRYLSKRAATQDKAPCGVTRWDGDRLFVNGVEIPLEESIFQEVKEEHEAKDIK